jgi:hypothetical protein
MNEDDPNNPLILQLTDLINERRAAKADRRSQCTQQIERFIEDHNDDPAFVRRAKALLRVDETIGRNRGERGIG